MIKKLGKSAANSIFFTALVGLILAGSGAEEVMAQDELTRPSWERGIRWTVRTRHAFSVAKSASADTGPAVVKWTFHVENDADNRFLVQIRSDMAPDVRVDLEINKDALAVESASLSYRVAGEERQIQRSHRGQGSVPMFEQIGPVPYLLPRFPLRDGEESEYERDIDAGGEIFEVKLVQSVRVIEDAAKINTLIAKRIGEPVEVPEADRYFVVTIQEGNDRTEQIWAEGIPWYIYSGDAKSVTWFAAE